MVPPPQTHIRRRSLHSQQLQPTLFPVPMRSTEPMVCFPDDDDDDVSSYSTPSASSEFGADVPPSGMLTSQEKDSEKYDPHAVGWGVGGPASLLAEASFGSVTSVAPQERYTYGPPPCPKRLWPATAQTHQPYYSTNTLGLGTSIGTPVSYVPPTYWGNNGCGSFTGVIFVDPQTPHQHSTGSTTSGEMVPWRVRGYERSATRPNEYGNTQAGPSILAPPLNTCTRHEENLRELRTWAQDRKGLSKLPSAEKALRIALEVLEETRTPVHPKPCLNTGQSQQTTADRKITGRARVARDTIRGLNEEISRYYLPPNGQDEWTCPQLLLKVMKDVMKPPDSDDDSPSASMIETWEDLDSF